MLVNISSGAYATDAVQSDLTGAKSIGKGAYEKYCKECHLEGN